MWLAGLEEKEKTGLGEDANRCDCYGPTPIDFSSSRSCLLDFGSPLRNTSVRRTVLLPRVYPAATLLTSSSARGAVRFVTSATKR